MSELEQVEILLVEDDESDAEMTIRCLTRVKLANNLVWVRDGAEALEFIFAEGAYSGRATGKPRLILLDLKMPRVDGIEVLSRIKADPRTRNIPVVMLTSSSVESDLVRSYALGVNSYLVKPIDFEHFGREIEKTGFYWLLMNRVPHA